jgi:hypothetical protein
VAKKQFGPGKIDVHAAVVSGTDSFQYRKILLPFVLHAGRPLAPSSIESVSCQPYFHPENILIEFILF